MFGKLVSIILCLTGSMALNFPCLCLGSTIAVPGLLSINEVTAASVTQPRAIDKTPERIVDELYAKAGNWSEPSRSSEVQYLAAIRRWLDTLEPFRRERARAILLDAHPFLKDLREAIREKKAELASLKFNRATSPETLPRLGMELQKLRANLRDKLRQVNNRLRFEAGVETGPMQTESFWVMPSSHQ